MVVVALAGRRIDAPDAESERFPAKNVADVRQRIRTLLAGRDVTTLVCAAACGADLLALDAAGDLGLRRRVVLPCPPGRFRETSVTDRPGLWGELFDRIIAAVDAVGDLVVLHISEHPEAAYATTNRAILDQAQAIARRCENLPSDQPGRTGQCGPSGVPVVAVAVWDRASRGEGDMTEDFIREAAARGLQVVDVPTR
jgi:hypothetical protein